MCLALWGLGGNQEGGGAQQTCSTLNATWTRVTAPLDTQTSSHTTLRAEVYLETTGTNLDLDGTELVNTGLSAASFEGGGGFAAETFAGGELGGLPRAGPPTTGSSTWRPTPGRSQRQACEGRAGEHVAGAVVLSLSMWIRSTDGGRRSGPAGLNLWGLGGTNESGGTNSHRRRQDTGRWSPHPWTSPRPGHTTLRAEVYLELSTGRNLDLDGAELVNTGLPDASFEGGSTSGWNLTPGANWAAYHNGTAHDGQYFLETNTGSVGGGGNASLWQDVPVSTSPGQSFSFSVWLRSPTGTSIGVCVVLWGLGGTEEQGQTCVTFASKTWRQVTAPLDTHASGHSTLRAQIYLETAGTDYDLDGATLCRWRRSSG